MNLQKQLCEKGLTKFSEYIKLLLYKKDESIFEILDFDDDKIYLDPLFFAYFNEKKEGKELESIIFGYQNKSSSMTSVNVKTDEFGRIYLPNIGWLITNLKNENLTLVKENLVLKKADLIVNYYIENIEIIEGTNIELLKYPIPLLNKCYYNTEGEMLDVEIEKITDLHVNNMIKAYNLIKTYIPEHFELIEKCNSKCVIFNVDTHQRNSFADVAAHGVGFYNAYQDDYNEVFFVDDIAHQTGHIIFTNMIFDVEEFLAIDKETIIEVIKKPDGTVIENRDIHVIYHALYTYYTTFMCLDACIKNNAFKGNKKHEALGRICFYLGKCYRDLLLIDDPITSSENSKSIFTKKGLLLYNMIKETWKTMYEKWHKKVEHFDMKNQLYNFSYSKFIELNPQNETIN